MRDYREQLDALKPSAAQEPPSPIRTGRMMASTPFSTEDRPSNTDTFIVHERTIHVPQIIDGMVAGDCNSTVITLRLERFFDGIDLSAKAIGIPYENAKQETGLSKSAAFTIVGDSLLIDWTVPSEPLKYPGKMKFSLRFSELDRDHQIIYVWQTKPVELEIDESILVRYNAFPADYSIEKAFAAEHDNSTEYDEMHDTGMPIAIDNREILMPDIRDIAVSKDTQSQLITFKINRYFKGVDLSEKTISIPFINALGSGDRAAAVNVSADASSISFGWLLDGKVTFSSGVVQFAIEFLGFDEKGSFYVWKTKPASFYVEDGLYVDNYIALPEPSWLQKWLVESDQVLKETKAYSEAAFSHAEETAASASAAKASEQNARTSEANASASEAAAKTSEGAAKQSEENAASSASVAGTSEQNAKASEAASVSSSAAALASQTAAKASEDRAKSSETNAAASAAVAKDSETAAKSSEAAAKASQTAAAASESSASASATAAATSAANAKTSETNAAASATAAKSSEQNAAASEGRAKVSETNVKASETSATASATAARASEQNAKSSETAAKASQTAAASSAQDALKSKNAAQASETAASTSASTATTKAQEASESAASALVQANRAKSEADRASAIANNLGWFATPEALRSAHATGEDGWIAIIGTTDSIWTWDSDSSAWVDTQNKGTGDYATMINKPQINGITLEGNRSLPDLGIQPEGDYTTTAALTSGLAGKVDKVTGKGLSAEDYTTAEKTKLAGLSNYDDGAIRASISALDSAVAGKVDKVAGKGLSTNDYTTAEKAKLAGLSNYDDTSVKASITAIETKNAAQDTAIAGKVDKVTGKGLSTNDYTTAEKQKLAGLSNYNDAEIRALVSQKASQPVSVNATLTAAGWSGSGPYTQTVSVTGMTAAASGGVSLAMSATAEQRETARSAMLAPTAQAAGSITITADGDKPAIDLPITVTFIV